MAMEPMGHVAGIAAAIIGSTSSIMSMLIGTIIGQMYNGTLFPVTSGFLIFGSVSLVIFNYAQRLSIPEGTAVTAEPTNHH
jgi:DHA1 family bicyclomycin/chloramphenicol resistance-like MFS transporter